MQFRAQHPFASSDVEKQMSLGYDCPTMLETNGAG
ncbi:hypothetical protein RLDS_23075 [Sphingobium lactosutens DS20]|uniref:Uncharacterized protein n=1 Tax=Sphingobium lactosutens DS20 TaxID=1331060 RepID=T0HGR8_9SPHN|nr:hypothetical protein RLDS_23075 [Sphingobium lactosutens DS20]